MTDAPNLNTVAQDLPFADLIDGMDIGTMTPEEASAHIDTMLATAFGSLSFSIFNHNQMLLRELEQT